MKVTRKRDVNRNYWVSITWQLKTNSQEEEFYQFDTEPEIAAFLAGVEACYGKKDFAVTGSWKDEDY
jgi:hypothetical protein